MYSCLVLTARIKDDTEYDWFRYSGKKPVPLEFRGNPMPLETGDVFGVRKSSNGKLIRLVFKDDINRVLTIDLKTAHKIAQNIEEA